MNELDAAEASIALAWSRAFGKRLNAFVATLNDDEVLALASALQPRMNKLAPTLVVSQFPRVRYTGAPPTVGELAETARVLHTAHRVVSVRELSPRPDYTGEWDLFVVPSGVFLRFDGNTTLVFVDGNGKRLSPAAVLYGCGNSEDEAWADLLR